MLLRESARPRRVRSQRLGYLLVWLAICTTVIALLWTAEPRIRHWFVVPVVICGTLVGADALPWLRGKRDLFDPVSMLSVLGVHFFFVAPLLHVYWDYWMPQVVPPPDWRPWLGLMAAVNAVGLLLYRSIITAPDSRPAVRAKVWRVERPRFIAIGLLLFAFTSALQIWVYAMNGGLTGYMNVVTNDGMEAFAGMGWLFVISESAPIIAMMVYAVAAERNGFLRRPITIGVALVVFFVLSLLFGGLRGSRSNTVWAIFWAAGIVHYRIRALSRRTATVGIAGLLMFMYLYGFYKDVSFDEAIRAVNGSEDRQELESKTGRTTEALLLADLARSDVQAFELYRLTGVADEYEYGWGRTYIGDVSVLIPEAMWPSRPQTKILEGTNLLFGSNSFRRGAFVASRVYGITGELMLNFGAFAAPLGFALLGLCVRTTDRALRRWPAVDARWLVAPVLVNLCFAILIGDGDNLIFFVIKSLLVPSFLLLVSTRRVWLADPRESVACSDRGRLAAATAVA